ncbi:ChaN family lipoprotein [Pukyongiella litopenaei]|uniref:ChaN family lipoprotein n=1 Tax=Pukyongiella litopenaei TaxID=2605946 RepID=A0A2S0MP76_9RHOB|nr:ChaN family lipoprotein [Pukyongiella litopenaei]AVO37637.1 ChaN family lipoprotein [Pukyongiella litopenaei]
MKRLALTISACAALWTVFCTAWITGAVAGAVSDDLRAAMARADVVILGEVHDNPGHHRLQAAAVEALAPAAVVWEMLTPEMAARFDAALLSDPDRLEAALGWADTSWPSFGLYYPVFAASGAARVYGGNVPRATARAVAGDGPAAVFGADAGLYGLDMALPAAEQAEREALQRAAHCNQLPEDRLAMMVDIQRLRDAVMARAVIAAHEETGGPVAVITGNGHARRDRGVPRFLDHVRPALRVLSVGQSEQGGIDGAFDLVLDSPAPDRDDPCDAFKTTD